MAATGQTPSGRLVSGWGLVIHRARTLRPNDFCFRLILRKDPGLSANPPGFRSREGAAVQERETEPPPPPDRADSSGFGGGGSTDRGDWSRSGGEGSSRGTDGIRDNGGGGDESFYRRRSNLPA